MLDPRAPAPTPSSSAASAEACSSPSRSAFSSSPERVAPRARAAQRSARTLLQTLVFSVPWLLAGAACSGDGDDDLTQDGDNVVGQGPMDNGGSGGTMAMGSGGSSSVVPSTGGVGGSSGITMGTGDSISMGGGAASGGVSSGGVSTGGMSSEIPGDLPAAPGETGIFVGMTAAHNAIRAGLDLDPPLPDLTWNQSLSDFAQQWANTLANDTNCGTIFHRDQRMYGENIAFSGIKGAGTIMYPPEEAVESWAAEVLCWDYGTILGNGQPTSSSESCDSKCIADQHSSGCGHYTQLVWRNTREVGCGYATCVDDNGFSDGVWVCNYSPPGNFVGQAPY
jgi:hypothetical protein